MSARWRVVGWAVPTAVSLTNDMVGTAHPTWRLVPELHFADGPIHCIDLIDLTPDGGRKKTLAIRLPVSFGFRSMAWEVAYPMLC